MQLYNSFLDDFEVVVESQKQIKKKKILHLDILAKLTRAASRASTADSEFN